MESTAKSVNVKKMIIRVLIYILGIFSLAIATVITINSNLGIGSTNSLPYVISCIAKVKYGTLVIGYFSLLVLLQIIILRKDFKPVQLAQVLFSVAFGYFVNVATILIGGFVLPTYVGQLAMIAMAVVIVGFGVTCYVSAQLVPMPPEGLELAISVKSGMSFPVIKTIFDCISVGSAIALSFLFLGGLRGVREGTVIIAVLSGTCVGIFRKLLGPTIRKLCFEEVKTETSAAAQQEAIQKE